MQLGPGAEPLPGFDAFSILGRIGGDATLPKRGFTNAPFKTFSILGRIGGDATQVILYALQTALQTFSILGRIGGDATRRRARAGPCTTFLSVSSVGSEAMQLGFFVWEKNPLLPFSILGRIGGDATNSESR